MKAFYKVVIEKNDKGWETKAVFTDKEVAIKYLRNAMARSIRWGRYNNEPIQYLQTHREYEGSPFPYCGYVMIGKNRFDIRVRLYEAIETEDEFGTLISF